MASDGQKENKMIYNHLGNTGLRVSCCFSHCAASNARLACVYKRTGLHSRLHFRILCPRRRHVRSCFQRDFTKRASCSVQVSALSYGAWVTFGTQVDVNQVCR